MQALTIKIRFFPDNPELLRQLSREYIHTVNALTEQAEKEGSFPKVTTKDVDAHLPSAVLNQAIRDAKSVSKKMKKEGKRPILKKPVYFVNNQNYTIGEQMIAFPIMLDGKTRKTRFRAMVTERDKNLIQHAKLGLMRIVEKRGKWYAQVSLGIPVTEKKKEKVMGVDLGLKVPAVAVTSNGKTRFFGNGRQNKYIRRNINGALVWHMEVCFPRDICLRDPIAVLSTFGDEAVQSTCSGRTDAGGDVIIPDNDGYFYDHRSDIRHLRLSTIRHLHLYGGSRYSFSIICSRTDLIASRPDGGKG